MKNKILSTLKFLPVSDLLPHEIVNTEAVKKMSGLLINDQYKFPAIIVDINTNVIIDGHHRFEMIKAKGHLCAPCVYIDYRDDAILALKENINGEILNKNEIIKKAQQGIRLPHKFTYHVVKTDNDQLFHLGKFNERLDINLIYDLKK